MNDVSADPLSTLASSLQDRGAELEEAALSRVRAIADLPVPPDPLYQVGLRDAVAAGIRFGLSAITDRDREAEPIPVEILAQARLAARSGVGLQEVIRRSAGVYALLIDGLIDEAASFEVSLSVLKAALQGLSNRYDQLVETVSDEYTRETCREYETSDRRRFRLLRRLLAGERPDVSGLCYDLNEHHLGLLASGPGAHAALASLRQVVDHRLLLAKADENLAWAWLGGREWIQADDLARVLQYAWPDGITVGCGAPGCGLSGWRLTHRQASSALSVAMRAQLPFANYGDVALVAAILDSDDLVAYLNDTFLAPLENQRGKTVLEETLRAYFRAGCNVSSAAVMVGVARQTVAQRLRLVEDCLGRSLNSCRGELEAALEVAEVLHSPSPS
jgi:hypothetical protein